MTYKHWLILLTVALFCILAGCSTALKARVISDGKTILSLAEANALSKAESEINKVSK